MTLTWILTGIILSKSGKTENKTNKTLLETLGKVVLEVRPSVICAVGRTNSPLVGTVQGSAGFWGRLFPRHWTTWM